VTWRRGRGAHLGPGRRRGHVQPVHRVWSAVTELLLFARFPFPRFFIVHPTFAFGRLPVPDFAIAFKSLTFTLAIKAIAFRRLAVALVSHAIAVLAVSLHALPVLAFTVRPFPVLAIAVLAGTVRPLAVLALAI
jgi:hypothetical protein